MDKIYIIEDDENIRNLLKIALEGFGYEAEGFETAEEGLERIKEEVPSLAIFDWMLPGMDGVTAIRQIRQTDGLQELPIMLLTAKEKELDKVVGLDCGADDYMVKPFEIIELLARVERVLRRYNKVSQTLTAYDIEVDTQSFQVKKAGVEIHLTKKEYEILVMFMRNPNVALFRERIFESVWHEPYYGDSRTVDLHVQRLRKKLGLEDKIVPVYKVGYRLEV